MTTPERLERSLPSILGDLAMGPPPTTSTTSSRRPPASGSGPPGRSPKGGFPWLTSPRGRRSRRASRSGRSAWRSSILALLVAAALVYVGTHQTRLPPPFGPAATA